MPPPPDSTTFVFSNYFPHGYLQGKFKSIEYEIVRYRNNVL